MNQWKSLEHDVSYWLKSLSTNEVHFRNSFQAIPGFPTSGFRSDGLLANKDILVAVEIEAGQTHPDTNVGKYWLLYSEFKPYKKISLFHVYTPEFNSYGWRLRLGEFYANKMKGEMPLEYILLDYRSRLQKDYKFVLADIKTKISQVIYRDFNITQTEPDHQ